MDSAMDNQSTPEFMLSLVRQAYRASPGSFSYKTFISRLWQELEKLGVPGIVKVPDQMSAVIGQPYNYALRAC